MWVWSVQGKGHVGVVSVKGGSCGCGRCEGRVMWVRLVLIFFLLNRIYLFIL